MSGFKRSPSKVWWGSDDTPEYRENSSSPGSQDSGFSDTETSPHLRANNANASATPKKTPPAQRIPKDIFKELSSEGVKQNLSTSYSEKTTPEKTKIGGERLAKSEAKASPKREAVSVPCTEPPRRHRFAKNSPKVSRSLFGAKKEFRSVEANQYSDGERRETSRTSFLNTSEEATVDDSYSWRSEESYEAAIVRSLPAFSAEKPADDGPLNRSAPGALGNRKEDEGVISANTSLSSDCESELECLFNGPLDSPRHTSTPKAGPGGVRMCHRRERVPLNLYLKYHNER
ncbi:hypothetical protein NQ318_013771 [Aromia moschata]|uniref:Uncharacterized protein n=1 Tax=Aromia moschata TaxID=1265417 RepID=A0AAV8ZA68_9CUCU|nr:hypothetical protein NQ318_013771 [Aromia moschata]